MKIINISDWKKDFEKSSKHLKINKPYTDLTDADVRILLNQIVDRLNLLTDKLISSYEQQIDIYEILAKVKDNEESLIKTKDSLLENATRTIDIVKEHSSHISNLYELIQGK